MNINIESTSTKTLIHDVSEYKDEVRLCIESDNFRDIIRTFSIDEVTAILKYLETPILQRKNIFFTKGDGDKVSEFMERIESILDEAASIEHNIRDALHRVLG